MIKIRKAMITKEYESKYSTPFLVKAGTILIAEEKVSEWKGWLWYQNSKWKI
jgi:hypothetical protein